MMRQRFLELDGLRGLAAVGVVVYHFTGAAQSKYPDLPQPVFTFTDGAYGVQLFFLISGFVILMSAQRAARPRDFVISRATRLYPTYWIALTMSAILAVTARLWYAPHDLLTILLNYTMIQRWIFVENVDEVYWTLAVEMSFYVLIFALLVVTQCRLTDRALQISGAAWLALSVPVALWASPASRGLDPQNVDTLTKVVLNVTLAEYAPLFVGGAFLYLSRQRGTIHPMVWISLALTALNNYAIRDTAHAIIVPGIFLLFIAVCMREHTRVLTVAPIQFVGKISYSLYITHAIPGYLLLSWLAPRIGRNLALIPTIAFCLLLAWGVWYIGEHTLSPRARRALTQALR